MHLCLTVEDIDVAETKLAEAGIALMRPRSAGRGIDGNRGMWIADPDGNQIEIMEMAPDCIQYQAELSWCLPAARRMLSRSRSPDDLPNPHSGRRIPMDGFNVDSPCRSSR